MQANSSQNDQINMQERKVLRLGKTLWKQRTTNQGRKREGKKKKEVVNNIQEIC